MQLVKQATSRWRHLLLVVASTSLSLLAVECGLRCWYPAPPRFASVFSYRRPDPKLGWRLEPGTKITYETSELKVEVEINSQGWRDAERTRRKPPGVYRIVVLGDSFMEAYSVIRRMKRRFFALPLRLRHPRGLPATASLACANT